MSSAADRHCVTCADEGVPMRVVAVDGDGLARCEAGGVERDVMVALVEPVAVGEELLVHAGVALARIA